MTKADNLSFLEQIRTVRHFSPEPVAPAMIEQALRAGQRAPTASNAQLYSVIQVDDPDLRTQIADAMVTQDFVRRAPLWLLICVDWSRQDAVAHSLGLRTTLNRAARRFTGIVDASIFAHHLSLALIAQGLGVCLIASPWTALRKVADAVSIPQRTAMPLHLLIAGHPAEPPRSIPRYPLEMIVSRNCYRAPVPEDVARYLEAGDRLLRSQGYFDGADTGVKSWPELYRVRYGAVARRRTWTPLRRDLAHFL
jgi:FMN reductase (NADPH)